MVKEKMLPMNVESWLEFLNGSNEKETDALRMATGTGRLAADEAFLNELSKNRKEGNTQNAGKATE